LQGDQVLELLADLGAAELLAGGGQVDRAGDLPTTAGLPGGPIYLDYNATTPGCANAAPSC
jgi:hypothetical protein